MLTIISFFQKLIKGGVGIRAGGWKIFQKLISGGGAITQYSRVRFLAILVKELSNFGNSCKETQFFSNLVLRTQKFGKICPENATHGTFGVEISLAKGIIFRKIGLANGAILKLWAAQTCPKLSREAPSHVKDRGQLHIHTKVSRFSNTTMPRTTFY